MDSNKVIFTTARNGDSIAYVLRNGRKVILGKVAYRTEKNKTIPYIKRPGA